MARFVVAITDNTFAPIDVERRLFSELGAEVRFGQALDEDAVIELARDADAILCDAAPISRRVIEALPRLRVVSEYGIGYDNIDVAAATEAGVWVANCPNFCTDEVADHTLALVLALARRILPLDRAVREGKWGAGVSGPMHRLGRQTLGVVGFGRIGQLVARKAAAIGMRVLAHSPRSAGEHAETLGVAAVPLREILARSDYVTLHAPVTPETRGIIDAAAIEQMKPTAYLVNTGRGALVDESALIAALRAGRIAGAALDVFAIEPPPADSPLFAMENVILTPHAAFYSDESLVDLQESATRNAIAVLEGRTPESPVNPEVAVRARGPQPR